MELAELYAARWTSETIYRHIKIEQRGGRTATLRSTSPAMVEQELWAMLCVYQAVAHLAADAAESGRACPWRTSASSRPSPPPDAPSARTFPLGS